MSSKFFLILASFLPYAAAQSGIATPALGYAFDPAMQAIRSVRGIPGAAVLGEPLGMRSGLTAAAISPAQDYAIALSPEEGAKLIRWDAGLPSAPIDGAIPAPDRIAFSPSGKAALLYDTNSGRMQALAGLPDSPTLQEIQPAGSSAAAFAIAIADDATIALARPDGAFVIGQDLSSSPLPLPGAVAALAFQAAGHDLVSVTGSGDIYLAKNVNGNLELRQIYPGDAQTASPVAVQFSQDGSTAFVANTAGVLASVDLTAGSIAAVSCQCAPTGLQPFGHPGLFRITEISNRPLLLFDGALPRPRIWFVPAEAQRSAQ